jgi:hypothetical protein
MKLQRQPISSFGPRKHSPLKKKLLGPRVGKKDIDEESRLNVSMPLSEARAAEAATPTLAETRRAESSAAVVATPAPAATSHATSSTCPAERAAAEATNPAVAASTSTPQASSAVPQGGMYGFIVQPNPKIQQLIQEMEHEGAMETISSAVPQGGMYGFIIRPNPKIQNLIQEMEREGAMETIENGLGRP